MLCWAWRLWSGLDWLPGLASSVASAVVVTLGHDLPTHPPPISCCLHAVWCSNPCSVQALADIVPFDPCSRCVLLCLLQQELVSAVKRLEPVSHVLYLISLYCCLCRLLSLNGRSVPCQFECQFVFQYTDLALFSSCSRWVIFLWERSDRLLLCLAVEGRFDCYRCCLVECCAGHGG